MVGRFPRIPGLVILMLWLFASASPAAEEIISFSSDIRLGVDGTILVTETIAVQAEGAEIRRGIYRDFPRRYKQGPFHEKIVPFGVVSILRNGQPEDWHTQEVGSDTRIYIGSKERALDPGIHTYTIEYSTGRQVGFFEMHDELYWNVTGNGWTFPIRQATATVTLPKPVQEDQLSTSVYTGPLGARDTNATATIRENGAWFASTAALPPGHGMTVVLTFPKGTVAPPDPENQEIQLSFSGLSPLIAVAGALAVFAWYFLNWVRAGIDPPRGLVGTVNHPPQNVSPAAARYLTRMGFDRGCLTAAIVSMAQKGFLEIHEDEPGDFQLWHRDRRPADSGLSVDETLVANQLFPDNATRFVLEQRNHKKLLAALKELSNSLEKANSGLWFVTNGKVLAVGIALSIAVYAGAAIARGGEALAIVVFMSVWLSIWSIGVAVLAAVVWTSWRSVLSGKGGYSKAIFSTLFATPFFAGEIFGIAMLVGGGGVVLTLLLVALVAMGVVFQSLLKRPSEEGRALMDQLEAYRSYLIQLSAERGQAARFESHLPYIVAMGIGGKLDEGLGRALSDAGTPEEPYCPGWYHRRRSTTMTPLFSFGAFDTALGGAVASSSTAPGSSSGSGGGGSSGGGGGGGGGGGW